MHMKRLLFLLPAFALFGQGCLPSGSVTTFTSEVTGVVEETVVGENGLHGLFVVPEDRSKKHPAVMVVHEWWGLNDQIKEEARRLAGEGYAVFAIDLYDGEVAADAARAGELAGQVRANPAEAERKMKLAFDFLEAQPEVDANRMASMGWCFGGGMSAIIGSSGDPRVKATVIYYGNPVTDASRLRNMSQPVLGIWGVEDQSIKVDAVRAFEQSLTVQGTPVEFHYYDGAGHAFANPTRGDAYRPEATADAWQKTLEFLEREIGS